MAERATAGQLLFHLISTLILAYSIYYDVYILKLPEDFSKTRHPFAGSWKFLTFWNANIQFAYFSFGIINDLFGTSSLTKKNAGTLQSIRDYFFSAWLYPYSCFVAFSFWGLYAMDREMVYPLVMDSFFPSWLNHVFHTFVFISGTIELVFIPKICPARSKALIGVFALNTSYVLWILYIVYQTNFWVYPLLAVLDWNNRLLFIATTYAFEVLFYFVGEILHYSLWGSLVNGDNEDSNPTTKRAPRNKKGRKQI